MKKKKDTYSVETWYCGGTSEYNRKTYKSGLSLEAARRLARKLARNPRGKFQDVSKSNWFHGDRGWMYARGHGCRTQVTRD